jgi:methionyl-tRNA formyltransferase
VAEAELAGERVRIHGAIALDTTHDRAPGTVLAAGRDGIDIACGDGALRIRSLQRESGRIITAADYLNARRDLTPPTA